MARGRFRKGTKIINGKKRTHIWARVSSAATLAVGAVDHDDALAVFEGLFGAELIGATVSLSHLDTLYLDDGTLTGAPDLAVLGARIFTQSTLSTLTTAQGPISDADADWFVYQPWLVTSEPNHQDIPVRVELHSQRVLKELGQSLLISVENGTDGVLSFRWAASIGVLLP